MIVNKYLSLAIYLDREQTNVLHNSLVIYINRLVNIELHFNNVVSSGCGDSRTDSGRGPDSSPAPRVSSPATIPRDNREGMGDRRRGVQVGAVNFRDVLNS